MRKRDKLEFIDVLVRFRLDELSKIQNEEDIEKIFHDKVVTALYNFKIEVHKVLKEIKRCQQQSQEKLTTPVSVPSSYVVRSIIGE